MLFQAGNLITIGIVLLVLIFFRLLDKSNNSYNRVKKYAERYKEDIAAFVEDKGAVIKNYGIALEVEKKSAMELMRRLQVLTREELAQKVQALAQIDDRIRDYDASLEELVQMTGRVQENLARIKDESSFVENVGKRVGEVKEKVENFDKEISSISKKLKTIEDHFERENTQALNKAVEEILNAAQSTVADLEAGARTIEREMEERREAADKFDREREEKLLHSEKQFEKVLLDAIDRAGVRADKAEEAAVAKLRDQAQERLTLIKNSFEEKIKSVQETIKVKLAEIQEQVKINREEWKAETAAIETRQKTFSADWKKDMQELNRDMQEFTAHTQQQTDSLGANLKKQREEWDAVSRDTGRKIIAAAEETIKAQLTDIQEQVKSSHKDWQAETAAVEEDIKAQLTDIQEQVKSSHKDWQAETAAVEEDIKAQLTEVQEQVKSSHEKWQAETAAVEARQKTYGADWKKDVQELTAFARQQKEQWNREIQEYADLARQQTESLGAAILRQKEEFGEALKKQREEWEAASRDTGQEIINATQDRIEEYRQAQEEQFRQLSGIANDAARLEIELRRSMQDSINRVNGDFAVFGQEMRGTWENASGEFNGQLQALRDELASIDRELAEIKEKAIENVSERLKVFEDEFLAELSKRGVQINQQLAAWQDTLNKRLESIAADSETKRQKTEVQITEDVKKAITAQGEKIISDLERLKAETAAFEEGIREEMRGADESRKSFSEQLGRDLEEVKNAAENEINTKIGQYNLSVAETLRQSQRDLETQIHELVTDSKERYTTLETSSEEFRKNIEEWQTQYNVRMRELDNAMEEARRRGRELSVENEERLMAARNSLDEMRHEITAQVKLFDRTDTLKAELNRHVEDMSGNIERLLQLKNEIAHFENQFIQIKRLEDDVNAKMTRFLSEKRRIEVMESDFTRLLQTSQSVEEKLAHVSNSDDILQAMQVQLRRLDDKIKETDKKYQRIDQKSATLQETNDSIDRNFRILQEDEQLVKRLEETISTLKIDVDAIQSSVRTLSQDNEKARDAAAKLSTLDETVKWLEKRIAEMNVARESLARLATELQNLDKDAQDQLNLTRSLLNREEGKIEGRAAGKTGKGAGKAAGRASDEGAPPPRDRENIIRLKRQGWSIDEIARSMKISKGEVELILELGPKEI